MTTMILDKARASLTATATVGVGPGSPRAVKLPWVLQGQLRLLLRLLLLCALQRVQLLRRRRPTRREPLALPKQHLELRVSP